jgi:A/G-specific adenine glycosylase
VLAYFDRFLQAFPTVAHLAAAPQGDVLALWSGLGYYSRARNLHACAQAVVALHGGQFPSTSAALATLPGIGRSTAAAIAAFCFGERAAILDGNVKRVLGRVLAFDGDLASAKEQNRLWALAETLLPPDGVATYTQGLMDLGATVCLRTRPLCDQCPLAAHCQALAQNRVSTLPVKSRKLKRSHRENALLWLQHGPRVWLVQRPQTGVWAGLWSLPEYTTTGALEVATAGWPGQGEWLPSVQHALTHFDWALHPMLWRWPEKIDAIYGNDFAVNDGDTATGRWFTLSEALALGLAAPVRKLLSTAADLQR